MTIRRVLRIGDPRLLKPALSVKEFGTQELRGLVEDMGETMAAEEGVGLAAVQIGVALRVVIFGFEGNSRYPDALPVPRTLLINPVIEPLTEEVEGDWEGCLSLPGMRGLVSRYTHIRYRGYSLEGDVLTREAVGFHARVVQHECDHLDGILYPQRVRDLKKFGYLEELVESGVMGAGGIGED